ncbi:retrovirus-related pol polyprotein from transposon TNT 1-94 [Tanacetum coccineum]
MMLQSLKIECQMMRKKLSLSLRPSYTAHPKSTVLCARPRTHFQIQAQSTVQRPFYKKTALTKRYNNQNVNTGRQTVNTGRQNVNTVRARGFNVGIKREYSVARTPQQNGVAERKNRTLIEAARTMLADSKLPTTFWAEAVSTACYVQNRVLIVKPHNKTPYELFRGIKPAIGFMKPFGCHVTILNTLDKLGKFDGKSDEGFFVGYSLSSKAFRVYNIRTRKVQENLHVGFLENKPYEEGNVLISSTPHTRIHKDHPIDHVIGDVQSSVQTRRMTTSYSELGFLGPTDERKAFLSEKLGSDGDAMTFDEHLYRSMIGSLMYLTASRPDIMFAVDFLASKKNNVVARLLSTEAEYVAVLQVLWTALLACNVLNNMMKRPTKGYSGQEVALFPTMLDDTAPSPTPSPSPEPTPDHTTAAIEVMRMNDTLANDSSKQGRKLSDAEVQDKGSNETKPVIQDVTPTEKECRENVETNTKQMNEEQRAQIARDEEIARQWDEEKGKELWLKLSLLRRLIGNDPSVIR